MSQFDDAVNELQPVFRLWSYSFVRIRQDRRNRRRNLLGVNAASTGPSPTS
jgi:hypothetical protein